MGSYQAEIDADALEFLADLSGGDARHALNAMETWHSDDSSSEDGKIHITLEVASECIQKRVVNYDKKGIIITIPFLHLSRVCGVQIRMQQCYYLAKMLYAGENVTFIARRIMICAAEDVGMQIRWHCR